MSPSGGLVFNPTDDYLILDDLVSVAYQPASGNGSYYPSQTVNNCTFFDDPRGAQQGAVQLRYRYAGLIVQFPEWPFGSSPAAPSRGDLFTITLEGIPTQFTVTDVDTDPIARLQWSLSAQTVTQ